MTSRQSRFVDDVYRTAVRAGLNDVQAALATTQAALETGYGKSVAGNNMFGIKSGTSWAGKTNNVATKEQGADGLYSTRDDFRAYDSFEDSLCDYIAFIEQNYPDAWNASTFDDAVAGLDSGRYGAYATDEEYGSKLSHINNRFVEPVRIGVELSKLSTIPVPTSRYAAQGLAADPAAPPTSPTVHSDYPTDPVPWVDDFASAQSYPTRTVSRERFEKTFARPDPQAPWLQPGTSDRARWVAYRGLADNMAQADIAGLDGRSVAPPLIDGEVPGLVSVEAGTPPASHTYEPGSLNRIPIPKARPGGYRLKSAPIPGRRPGAPGAGAVPIPTARPEPVERPVQSTIPLPTLAPRRGAAPGRFCGQVPSRH